MVHGVTNAMTPGAWRDKCLGVLSCRIMGFWYNVSRLLHNGVFSDIITASWRLLTALVNSMSLPASTACERFTCAGYSSLKLHETWEMLPGLWTFCAHVEAVRVVGNSSIIGNLLFNTLIMHQHQDFFMTSYACFLHHVLHMISSSHVAYVFS